MLAGRDPQIARCQHGRRRVHGRTGTGAAHNGRLFPATISEARKLPTVREIIHDRTTNVSAVGLVVVVIDRAGNILAIPLGIVVVLGTDALRAAMALVQLGNGLVDIEAKDLRPAGSPARSERLGRPRSCVGAFEQRSAGDVRHVDLNCRATSDIRTTDAPRTQPAYRVPQVVLQVRDRQRPRRVPVGLSLWFPFRFGDIQ